MGNSLLTDQATVLKLARFGGHAFLTLAQVTQVFVSVEAGFMTVFPDRFQGVKPDRFKPTQPGFFRVQPVDKSQATRLAHLTFASSARAIPAQGRELSIPGVPIIPLYTNFGFGTVNFDFFRLDIFQDSLLSSLNPL